MKQIIFRGCATALVTPFSEDGKSVNYDAFKHLIDNQISNGINALVFLGTTGEPATMTQNECDEVIKFAVNYVAGRVPVIAGAGGNNTKVAIEKSMRYEQFGVDGLLHVTPYYNKCTQSGLIKHFEEIAKSVKLPIILYNVPGRTGVNLLPATVEALCNIPNIVAVKEASGNIEQISEIARLCQDKIHIYSGDDGITIPILSLGGIGVISVASNVIPREMCLLCNAWEKGDIKKARELQFYVNPLVKALFCEVNPIPVKTALNILGYNMGALRLPLCEMQNSNKELLKKELKNIVN